LWKPDDRLTCRHLRDWPDLQAKLGELRAMEKGSGPQKKGLSALGLNSLYFAFDPEYVPHVVPTHVAPQDLLHLFFDGITRNELAWLFYVFFKLGLDFEAANTAIRR
jgi:hypothetical protein